MQLDSLQEIERAIEALPPQELAKLYTWLGRYYPPPALSGTSEASVFEQGLGLFGSPNDAALLDEVVHMAYEERRHPSRPATTL
jgi:hypothetical protein